MKSAEMFNVKGKKALVVGGGQGIGRCFALTLAEAGAEVTVADFNVKTGGSVVQEIKDAGGKAQFVKADANKSEDLSALMAKIAPDGLDIAVNCPIMKWETVREYCLAEAELIKRQGRGKLINLASMCASIANVGCTESYNQTKAAVVMLTKSLAVELGPHNINVNCISPSYTLTPARRFDKPEFKERVRAFTPMGWYERPEDLCGALIFLASPASDYMTGQNLTVDGGHTLNVWMDPIKRAAPPLISPEEEVVSLKHDLDILGVNYDENVVALK